MRQGMCINALDQKCLPPTELATTICPFSSNSEDLVCMQPSLAIYPPDAHLQTPDRSHVIWRTYRSTSAVYRRAWSLRNPSHNLLESRYTISTSLANEQNWISLLGVHLAAQQLQNRGRTLFRVMECNNKKSETTHPMYSNRPDDTKTYQVAILASTLSAC